MKNFHYLLPLAFTILLATCQSQTTKHFNKEEGLQAFAKLYGYIKYFHPSDEAAAIDWDAFAVYGAEEVAKSKSKEELVKKAQGIIHAHCPNFNDIGRRA